MDEAVFGLDFGTTNSSIALVGSGAEGRADVRLARFRAAESVTESFRSLLYLEQREERGVKKPEVWAGPRAIEEYLQAETKGRLIQSLKSFLSSRTLRSTEIFGRQYQLEDLIARIMRAIREEAEEFFGQRIRSVAVGKPVWFVGASEEADNRHALGRLETALQRAGFEEIHFEFEPIGAAYHYRSTLNHEELILIGDFGGGTSDFSLLRIGPGETDLQQQLLGNSGLGLAGDSFDAKIIRHVVSPALGAGTEMRSLKKILPVPQWVYSRLERWHHVSFLKSRDTLNMLQSVRGQALEPEKIEALLYLIEEDLGYQLHQAVQKVKVALSHDETAQFRFDDGVVLLEEAVKRSDFENWISEELQSIEECVDNLLKRAGVDADNVDAVFLTGGTSFVPSVRRIFETRFGAARIRSGNEFTSVARGLALAAQQRSLSVR